MLPIPPFDSQCIPSCVVIKLRGHFHQEAPGPYDTLANHKHHMLPGNVLVINRWFLSSQTPSTCWVLHETALASAPGHSGFLPNRSVMPPLKPFLKIINIISKCMIIIKMVKKLPKYHFFKYFWSVFGSKKWFWRKKL